MLSAVSCQLSTLIYAQDELKKVKQLEAQVLSNTKDKKALQSLDMLSEMYFGQHQYNSFVEFLKKLAKKKPPVCSVPVSYYISLCRYHQLKYLEETKNWKEYFDQGNNYRQELFSEAQEIVRACPESACAVRAQLLSWLQHKAQNDSQMEGSLTKLIAMAKDYGAKGSPEIEIIKQVADNLREQQETALAKGIYNLYVKGLIEVEKSPLSLESSAEDALKGSNIDLAEIIYERYIDLIKNSLAKDTLAQELIVIIKNFATDGWNKGKDPLFAEKALGILKELCGKSYLSEDLQYGRAYNLQRLKEYAKCAQEYALLIEDFPESAYRNEAEFKLGLLYTYCLGQKEKGLSSWNNLIERNLSPNLKHTNSFWLGYAAESLYQKGIISQYEGALETAGAGYAQIIELLTGKDGYKNLLERTKARQKEIEQTKPMEYNLKMFLDTALKQPIAEQGGLEVKVFPFKVVSLKVEEVKFSIQQYIVTSGCMAPELTYLWSGDTGNIQPLPTTQDFTTAYETSGVKVVNAVVTSPSGVVGSTLEMEEVYEKAP